MLTLNLFKAEGMPDIVKEAEGNILIAHNALERLKHTDRM